MCSLSKKYSSFEINDKIENKPVIKIPIDNSISISINSQITIDNSKNISIKDSIKNMICKIKRSRTFTLFINKKKAFYIGKKILHEKEGTAFNSSTKTRRSKENKKNEGNKEIKENRIEIKENKIEINGNKIEIKEEETNININNIKSNNVNKKANININENSNVNGNTQKNIKIKIYKDDNYTQAYCRNDFCDRPPKISRLFMDNYDYENKNIFSHSNDTNGNIKGSKKIPNIFYNHLLINNVNNEKFINTSLNKRSFGKISTFIFYTPRTIFV